MRFKRSSLVPGAVIICTISLAFCGTDKRNKTNSVFTYDINEIIDTGADLKTAGPGIKKQYNKLFFSPWHTADPIKYLEEDEKIFFKNVTANFSREPGYGENRLRRNSEWIAAIAEELDQNNLYRFIKKGITVKNTSIRLLPVERPIFRDIHRAGSDYPFDELQHSAVWAGTPLLIAHRTRDRSWYLVKTGFVSGWAPAADIAMVDQDFIRQWESSRLAAVIKDRVPLISVNGQYICSGRLGAFFPLADYNKRSITRTLLVPSRDKNGNAVINRAAVPAASAELMPLTLSGQTMKKLIDEITGTPYGWGGLHGNRDCSLLTRDLFAPFGIWLPKHSKAQAVAGKAVQLPDNPQLKEKVILEKGKPFATLLYMPGHIMLYVGKSKSGNALVFHTLWGLKTIYDSLDEVEKVEGTVSPAGGLHKITSGDVMQKDGIGVKDIGKYESRKIIGRAVISDLHLDRNVRNVQRPFIKRISRMIFVEY